ncbi:MULTISPECIES: DUF2231 domain-containing protein [Amycolatopsis]|uniref:DUF2231 domain-containing protein n=1 Tax=Amycolatopsis tucumanensis TaxID=401106 RepID=A0ABP7IZH8_9PSEU|nr:MULTISPECIES: DUF2231 domain-containing protein [Amycolatopsis]MCF6427080.1 DUF2231 domain-containing protein [Amycolatopsis tucumanensis]
MKRILTAAESLRAVDPATSVAARGLRKVIGRGAADRLLRGAWLGHPVHPLLVTLPIGAWLSSAVLDLTGQPEAARRLVTIGLAATPPTVLTGLAEFSGLDTAQRRVGAIHAVANTLAAGCFLAANRSSRRTARFWAAAGLVTLSAGGALGGHLSYAQGAGVGRWSSLQPDGQ